MSIDRVVNMQLSVMRPSEAAAAANILKKAHSSWSEVPPDFYDSHILPGFTAALRPSFAIVGSVNGVLCAAYEPPNFAVEGKAVVFGKKRYEGTWASGYTGTDDYFAAHPENNGNGRAFFLAFGRVLEQLAHELGSPVAHRIQATHRSVRFFEKLGYTKIHYSPTGLQFDYHLVEKGHAPVVHDLPTAERQVVDALTIRASAIQQTI